MQPGPTCGCGLRADHWVYAMQASAQDTDSPATTTEESFFIQPSLLFDSINVIAEH